MVAELEFAMQVHNTVSAVALGGSYPFHVVHNPTSDAFFHWLRIGILVAVLGVYKNQI
jgi:hypothetical protein